MKKKIYSLLLAASLLLSHQIVKAQSWNLVGNTNLAATSKIGGTSATTAQNFPLSLWTYGVERIHITANTAGKVGYVGIGTPAPSTRLHVNGVITATGGNSNAWNFATRVGSAYTTSRIPRWSGTAFVNGIITDNGNNVGIGTTAPSQKLHVIGSGLFTTGVTASGGGISGTSTSGGHGVSGNGYIGVLATSSSAAGDGVRTTGSGSSCYGVNSFSTNSFGLYAATGNVSSYAGYFSGNVFSSGVYTGSDRKLKQNINDFNNAMDVISQLQPKVYEYRQDGNYQLMNLPLGNRYGLIAQDVEKILPNLVKKTEFNSAKALPQGAANDGEEIIDFKAVNYTELIPIMIKAMQEQQKEIADLKAENQQMKQDMQNYGLNQSSGSINDKLQQAANEKPTLGQNAPNPFNEQTVIRYYVPTGSNAVLKVVSLEGKEMYSTAITKSGYGELSISGSPLPAGAYTYTLIVNGKAVESKNMVLTK